MKEQIQRVSILVVAIGLMGGFVALRSQAVAPKTHRLEATPATVAFGYYWAEAKPVLRIASGSVKCFFGTRVEGDLSAAIESA